MAEPITDEEREALAREALSAVKGTNVIWRSFVEDMDSESAALLDFACMERRKVRALLEALLILPVECDCGA